MADLLPDIGLHRKILAIDVVNVDVIGVIPAYRPRLNKSEPIAAVLEAGISPTSVGLPMRNVWSLPKSWNGTGCQVCDRRLWR